MSKMTIGRIAKQVGVSTDTIRLYERYGLIDEPVRTESGYRCYGQQDVRRLLFIKRAKAMGFTLKEIAELLAIRQTSEHTCDDVREQATHKLNDTQHKIAELKQLAKALQILIDSCEEHKEDQHCPILDALEQQDQPELKT